MPTGQYPTIRGILKKSSILVKIVKKIRIFRHFRWSDWKDGFKIRLFWQVEPYTTVGYDRLNNAFKLAVRVEKEKIPGDLVECGTWKGGCAAAMAYAAGRGKDRKVWLFDSFEGLPEPGEADGPLAKEFAADRNTGKLKPINECVASVRDAEEIFFDKLKISRDSVKIVKGWLQDTLPAASAHIGPIAILRLDVDWHESTKICLEYLYDKVAPGGYVIFDDYGHWPGCRLAVDEFFEKRGLKPDLKVIDYTGRYMKKN
ncbi:MAG: TylF/MycF/NovP-related O-methyltransferase [Candidatus Falkowbacteria bacterium]